jgi:formate dehydrogenase major subunit
MKLTPAFRRATVCRGAPWRTAKRRDLLRSWRHRILQGSTIIGIANLAMATGNAGREGVGELLRGQNNVQGPVTWDRSARVSRLSPRRGDDAVRDRSRARGGAAVRARGCASRTCSKRRSTVSSRVSIEGEDIGQSDPNTQHVTAALTSMECIVVQDLFLNETAKFAHVFLPGSTFLEKDGTFTNAERRISRVRTVMRPKNGYADWEITQLLSNAMGYPMNYAHPSQIMDEVARLTPTFAGVSFDKIDKLGSIQWPCNAEHPDGTPTMHVGEFVRGRAGSCSRICADPRKGHRDTC